MLSLADFDNTYGFIFEENPQNVTLENLLIFCEYTKNLIENCIWDKYRALQDYCDYDLAIDKMLDTYLNQMSEVINVLQYSFYQKENGKYILIPNDQVLVSVVEVVDDDLSYRVIEYNHYSMKGDINQKKTILLQLATKLEPQRNELKRLNKTLEDNLFFLFNNLNIRHNNVTAGDNKNYKETVAKMSPDELENWYDETYQLCLLAFLELDNVERMQKIKELKKKIKS